MGDGLALSSAHYSKWELGPPVSRAYKEAAFESRGITENISISCAQICRVLALQDMDVWIH